MISVQHKGIKPDQVIHLKVIFHVLVSNHRLLKVWNLLRLLAQPRNGLDHHLRNIWDHYSHIVTITIYLGCTYLSSILKEVFGVSRLRPEWNKIKFQWHWFVLGVILKIDFTWPVGNGRVLRSTSARSSRNFANVPEVQGTRDATLFITDFSERIVSFHSPVVAAIFVPQTKEKVHAPLPIYFRHAQEL